MNLHEHLPTNLRDIDVVGVKVLSGFRVRVVHRDGTSATHVFDPSDFHGDYAVIGTPGVFATAAIVDGGTLGWELPDGLIYDVAPDSLWLHARGHCDGSHDLDAEVER